VNRLLRSVPAAQRPLVRVKGSWLAADVAAWASGVHAQLGRQLYENLAFGAAAVAPAVRCRRLAALVRYGAWVYLLDDRLDAPGTTVAQVRQVGVRLAGVVRGQRPAADDFLEAGLADVLADLDTHDRGHRLMPPFAGALMDGVAAGIDHAERSRQVALRQAAPPSAEEYLDVASEHIGYRSLALGIVLVMGEYPSRWALDRLTEALVPASRAVRLANDLRTLPKDEAEQSLNVLALRRRDGTAVTPEAVVGQIARYARTHHELLQIIARRELGPTCRALARSIRIALGTYRVADLKHQGQWAGRPIPAWRAVDPSVAP
jgi:hypothetical protein